MRRRSVHVSQCAVWCATPARSISCVAHLSGKTGLEWAKERGHHALVAAVEVCMRPMRRAGLIRANRVMGGCSCMRTLPSSSWPRALSLFQSISVSVSVHRGSFNACMMCSAGRGTQASGGQASGRGETSCGGCGGQASGRGAQGSHNSVFPELFRGRSFVLLISLRATLTTPSTRHPSLTRAWGSLVHLWQQSGSFCFACLLV